MKKPTIIFVAPVGNPSPLLGFESFIFKKIGKYLYILVWKLTNPLNFGRKIGDLLIYVLFFPLV